jgi:SAM-dependent methyltransferase
LNDVDGVLSHDRQRAVLRSIIGAYDSPIVRAYCFVRFMIININMLHILSLCMRGKTRILEIGCGFGLFGCYFAKRWPNIRYSGIDINDDRIEMAREAARRLALTNVSFQHGDASQPLDVEGQFDAVLMMDLLHHLPDAAKQNLLDAAVKRLKPGGHLIIKDVTRVPAWKLGFTWILDVLMTSGFDLWYWNPDQFRRATDRSLSLETFAISDWLPYPHIVYLFSKPTGPEE